MVNKRHENPTSHCNWCNRVRSGNFWVPERRKLRSIRYASTVCPKCRSFYLTGFDLDGFMKWYREEVR